jgi:glycosyltransferase involved in cell wall biosynthesis
MEIGIHAVAVFKQPRTGVEEYAYHLIKHLTMLDENKRHRFVLYSYRIPPANDLELPDNFKVRHLRWPLPMWTQLRLSAEMSFNQPEVLFIPVHVLPLIHPKNSIVAIHGLEYEYYPGMYPWRHLKYLRWSTQSALKKARKIIAVSENTKKDLVKLYGGQPDKIKVIHHGFTKQGQSFKDSPENRTVLKGLSLNSPFILFIGRIETKKNLIGILEAYKILKEKYQIPHKLVLAGSPGFGYDVLKLKIKNYLKIKNLKSEIIETNYVSEQKKQELFKNAETFIFPSFYEGFGIPILEAQAAGCSVITSNVSSMPEVAGSGALLVNPKNIEEIAQAMYKIISNREVKRDLINKGYENVKRFSWDKCARETLNVLTE